ncbi:MAG TPA: TetR/AcrR family transcriptional regulator [Reyranella sp.]|nr:TetR/AcrR family transcriptional regulator [Reyranella sp.]
MAKKATARAYHHGSLREALIEATLELIEEGGPEAVSVREAARRAGVSPGAPFRHFPNRTTLMTAVAEQATHRLHRAIFEAVGKAKAEGPLERLRAMGRAYLRWALDNPTHFAVASNRSLIDYESSESMKRENGELQALMSRLLQEAQRQGEARNVEPATMLLAARGLVYGLARMRVDGHLPQWGVRRGRSARALESALDLFVSGLARSPK